MEELEETIDVVVVFFVMLIIGRLARDGVVLSLSGIGADLQSLYEAVESIDLVGCFSMCP